MKQKSLLKTMLLLCALVAGGVSAWAEDQTWSHEFASPEAVSNNSITVNGVTWNISTVTGKGNPTIDKGNSYSKYCLKFGSGANNYFSSVTFTTNYFNNCNVKSVTLNVLHNVSKQGTLTATQGNTTIGSSTQNIGTTWTDVTVNTTAGSGGTLSITYSPSECALNVHSITVNYTTGSGSNTYSVTYDANGATSGSVPTDANEYEAEDVVTVLGNTGDLAKTGYTFGGWNTLPDGNGTTYTANQTFNITANTTLYAKWNPYAITAQSNNISFGTVSLEGFVITGNPFAGYTYASPAYTVSSGSATVEQEGDEFTVTPSSDCTVTINFAAIPTHTATFSVNGVTSSSTFYEGQAIEFPSDPADINGKSFVGWLKNSTISGTTNEDPGIVNQSNETMGESDVTYYAVFADVTPGDETTVTDVLTRETTGVNSGSGYSEWKGITCSSNAVYAGNSAGGNNAIQLRVKEGEDSSGIVSTESGGKVTKVKVTWNSNTVIGRTLDIFGNDLYYPDPSLLYDSDVYGTLLGSIVYGTSNSTELTIDGDYQYIGLRSHENAMYLDKIEITWTTGTPDSYSNYRTTFAVLEENTITGIEDSYTIDLALVHNEAYLDLSGATATSGATVQFEMQSPSMDGYCSLTDGVLKVWGNGIITIRAYVNGDETYNNAEKIVTVTVVDEPNIAYDEVTETTAYGTNYTVDEYLIEGGAVSLVSGNTDIATVEGLVITPVAVGSVTITVNTAATEIWHAGTATFTLNITAPEGSATAPETTIVFSETFAGCTGTNNNFGYGTSGAGDGNGTYNSDNNWTVNNAYGADGAAKFGTSKQNGSATSPSIAVESGKTYRLSFKAAPWSNESTEMTVSVTGGTINNDNSVTTSTMEYGEWNEFSYDIVASSTSMTLAFEASNNRFFLDDVKLTTNVPVTTTVTLNKYGYATYCSETPIDFSSTTGYTAWRVSSVDADGTITFARITEKIKGGQGVLLYNKDADGVNNSEVTITFADGTREFSASENLLEGTLAPTYVEADTYYGLSGESFVKVNAGTVPAGKALLPASVVDGSNARLTFVFEEATGIATFDHSPLTSDDAVYNLNGQRVNSPKKGLYIVNGKKVLVK